MTDQPSITEPVPVQLTRMEGTVNLIAYQIGDLTKNLAAHAVVLEKHGDRLAAVETKQSQKDYASKLFFGGVGVLAASATIISGYLALRG